MKWLFVKGFTVVGVEEVEKAILELFSEIYLKFDVFTKYSTKDSKLMVFKGNPYDFRGDVAEKTVWRTLIFVNDIESIFPSFTFEELNRQKHTKEYPKTVLKLTLS